MLATEDYRHQFDFEQTQPFHLIQIIKTKCSIKRYKKHKNPPKTLKPPYNDYAIPLITTLQNSLKSKSKSNATVQFQRLEPLVSKLKKDRANQKQQILWKISSLSSGSISAQRRKNRLENPDPFFSLTFSRFSWLFSFRQAW